MRSVRIITCKICNKDFKSVGIATHIQNTHKLTVDQYAEHTGHEYRPKVLKYSSFNENKHTCKICNSPFHSNKRLFHHIKIHNISNEEYVKKYILENKILCKCGCGQEVQVMCRTPWKREYISGHNSKGETNGRYNKLVTAETKELMSQRAIARVGKTNKINTNLELEIKDKFDKLGITYEQQYITQYGAIDFYLPEYDILLEVDGMYWHTLNQESLNFYTISNSINDYKKVKNLPNLIKIYETNIEDINSINDLHKFKYSQNFNIDYHTKVILKDYFTTYKKYKGIDKLKSKTSLLLKYIRTLHPEFPSPTTTETISDITKKISEHNLSSLFNDNIFSNNCSNVGVSYLKSKFNSYWNSKYKSNNLTPIEAWNDDRIMKRVIEYRIGCNNSDEVYDFTLHQLIRGLSANRYLVSLFKPMLAAAIYKHFLGNNQSPTVLDPCAGFGGRLLGFKSTYPDGVYIGVEPNIDTYNELVELSKNFTNVHLYNCRYEEFNLNNVYYDLAFTSIPYYDLEIYSNHQEYINYNEWCDTFLNKIKITPKMIVNIPNDLRNEFPNIKNEYFLKSNTSHFNKKANTKLEYILQL